MPLKIGSNSIGSVYRGSTPIAAIYKGTNLVFTAYTFAEWYAQFVYETLVPKTVSGLPAEYQEVEYIESSGTQYIDTQFNPQNGFKIQASIIITSLASRSTLFGFNGNSQESFLRINANGSATFWANTVGGAVPNLTFSTNTKYNIECYFNSSAYINVNGATIQTLTTTNSYYNGSMPLLCCGNIGGSNSDYGYFQLFSCCIYNSTNALVRNFIPCYRKADNVIGLYDTVYGVFYTNAGTGTFTKGNDITATANNIGKSNLVKIEGNGVVENQLVSGGEDEKTSVTAGNVKVINYSFDCVSGHKYLCSVYTKATGTADTLRLRTYFSSSVATNITQTTNYTQNCIIVDSNTTSATAQFEVQYIKNDSNFDGDVWAKKCEIIDLTLMFGTGNEPSSLDDKRIQAIINRGYIPYNTGSYKASQVESVRFNQYNLFGLNRIPDVLVGWNTARTFDLHKFYTGVTCNNYSNSATVSNVSETENSITFTTSQSGYGVMFPVRVIGGRTYTLSSTEAKAKAMSWYDKDGNFITWKDSTNASFSQAAPTNAYYCGIVLRPDAGTHTYTNVCFCESGTRTDYAKHISYLPSLYQQVEWISGDGNQHIETSYISGLNTEISVDYMLTDYNGTEVNYIFGEYESGKLTAIYKSASSSSNVFGVMFGSYDNFSTKTMSINTRYKVVLNKTSATVNGESIKTLNISTPFTPTKSIYIFRGNGSSRPSAIMKLYGFSIKESGALVMDLVPCYRKTDNEIGLYDMVGGKFYANAGTGTFNKGSDVKSKTNEIVLPAPVQLGGAINAHDTFAITDSGYVFTKNVGMVDLGSLSWTYQSDQQSGRFYANLPTLAVQSNYLNGIPNLICSKYETQSFTAVKDKTIYCYTLGTVSNIFIKDSAYTDATSFVTAMSGVNLYYELATPQTITIPKAYLGCVDLGTLSWNYDSANTRFYANFSGFKSIEGWASSPCNLYCSKYTSVGFNYIGNDKSISGYSGYRIYITDKIYSTAADLKASLSGVYLFYETTSPVVNVTSTAKCEVGGTVTTNEFRYVENQLVQNGDISQGTTNWHTNPSSRVSLSASNGVLTAEWLVTDYGFQVYKEDDLGILNHKYLVSCLLKPSVNLTFSSTYGVLAFNALAFGNTTINANVFTQCCGIITATNSTYLGKTIVIQVPAGSIGDTVDIKNAMVIDLTVAFGSGNEPTSVNDSRIQYLLNKGYIDTNTTGTESEKQTETLPNLYLGLQEE